MTAHDNIRIVFEIKGRKFEAVGFLHKGESLVSGEVMLERINFDYNVVGERDDRLLRENAKDLPTELRGYLLVTNRRHPDRLMSISCYDYWHGHWQFYWLWLEDRWNSRTLVLRRRA